MPFDIWSRPPHGTARVDVGVACCRRMIWGYEELRLGQKVL